MIGTDEVLAAATAAGSAYDREYGACEWYPDDRRRAVIQAALDAMPSCETSA